MTVLNKQAKAIATGVALLLVQVQVFIGQGGVDELTAVTLGQWVTVALGVLAGYGVVYNIPNVTDERVVVEASLPDAPFIIEDV